MIFKRRELGEQPEVIGEARVVDPSEDITDLNHAAIEAIAEAQLVTTTAVIGQSIVVRGEISGDEDLIVEGRVEGTVALPGSRLTIGSSGDVAADIAAKTLNIEGQIKGDVDAIEKVVLKASGNMQGNITAPRITLEDGCIFNGTISMASEPSAVVTDLKQSASSAVVGNGAGANVGGEQQAV